MSGITRRLARLFHSDGKALIVAMDYGLITGPVGQLSRTRDFLQAITRGGADGILVFSGSLSRFLHESAALTAIVNLTASIKGTHHTDKVWCTSIEEATHHGADAVPVHINVSDEEEGTMIKTLGRVTGEAHRFGLPVLAIVYPRQRTALGEYNYEEERRTNPSLFGQRIQHCVRIGVELGAHIIKTQYTGDQETLAEVVEVACGVPIFIAGGEKRNEMMSYGLSTTHSGPAGRESASDETSLNTRAQNSLYETFRNTFTLTKANHNGHSMGRYCHLGSGATPLPPKPRTLRMV